MLKSGWAVIMDPERNALKSIPRTVRFQFMVVLASLWSAIFCANMGLMLWLPGYLIVHVVLLLIGIFGTRWLFQSASRLERQRAPNKT
jgi:hypothetical protein